MTHKSLLIILTIIVTFALMGCSRNTEVAPPQPQTDGMILPTKSVTTYPAVTVPSWLLYTPEGEYSIGIAWDTPNKKKAMTKFAQNFATESLGLNHGSYSVDKNAALTFIQTPGSDTLIADYNVNLVTNPAYIQKAGKDIRSLAETSYLGYRVYLYGYDTPKLYNEYTQASVANLPSWCKGNYQYEEDGYIYSVGYGQDASLITAWKKAQEDGLRKLARFRFQQIGKELRSTKDNNQKTLLLDQVKSTMDAKINKSWLFHRTVDKVSDFNVFILLKTKA